MSEPAAAEIGETEKRVSWAELFFDLVFVFAVTEVSAMLHNDHSWTGALRALIVFVPIYWTWVGTSIQANLRDLGRPLLRLGVFGVALAGMFMALSVSGAYGGRAVIFALSYWGARLLLGLLLFGGSRWALINPFLVSMVLTGPLLVLGALLPSPVREAVWATAALIDLSTPTVLRGRMRGIHFHAPHLAERFGLFVLIAIGESVVAIGASVQSRGRLDVPTGLAVGAAFAVSCGLWWVYFQFAADAVRHALATAQVQLDIARLVLSYGHLAFIGAIIAVGVGLRDAVAEPGQSLSWAVVGLLFGGAALFLATFGYTRWTMFRLVSWTRLSAEVAVSLLALVAPLVPSLAALLLLAAALAALNVVEYRLRDILDWRTALRRRMAKRR